MSNAERRRLVHRIHHAAEMVDSSRATLYRENKAGRLPFIKIGTATYVTDEALRAWLAGMPTLNGADTEAA